MSKVVANQEFVKRLTKLLTPIVNSKGLILVELQLRPESSGLVLRLFVDWPEGGINLEECVQISRQVGCFLDVEDIVPGCYHLEVSSPGLTKSLVVPKDYEIFVGRMIKILVQDQGGKSCIYRGELKGLQEMNVHLGINNQLVIVPLNKIIKANLDINF